MDTWFSFLSKIVKIKILFEKVFSLKYYWNVEK